MGRTRTRLERLETLLPSPQGEVDGLVPTTSHYVDANGVTQYTYDLQPVAGGGVSIAEVRKIAALRAY